jgi:hypothetical protein
MLPPLDDMRAALREPAHEAFPVAFHKPVDKMTDDEVQAEFVMRTNPGVVALLRRIGGRALIERQCMRQALRRAVKNIVIAAGDGTEREKVIEFVYRMHCVYVQLLIFTGRCIGDWNMLVDDERYREECQRAATAAVSARFGRQWARGLMQEAEKEAERIHPEYAPMKAEAEKLLRKAALAGAGA